MSSKKLFFDIYHNQPALVLDEYAYFIKTINPALQYSNKSTFNFTLF